MSISHLQLGLPSAWNLSGQQWLLDRPVTFLEESAALPRGYIQAADLPNHESRVCDFYTGELENRFGVRVSGDPAPDTLARAAIEHNFQRFLTSRKDEELPYYYGYFEGCDRKGFNAGLPLRMIGLFPQARQMGLGILLDLRGYGHSFDHDWNRTAAFLEAGFTVFTPDRTEHGLSARLDPRREELRSVDVWVRQTVQALHLVNRFRQLDSRLSKLPFYALASSLGGAELVGAFRSEKSDFGLSGIHFDNPLFSFGSLYGAGQLILMDLAHSIFERWDRWSPEQSFFYRRRSGPSHYEGQTDDSFHRTQRFFDAFGPTRHPVAIFDLSKLVQANRKWLLSDESRRLLPKTLMTFAENDVEVNVEDNIGLFRAFGRPEKDGLRATSCHSPFVAANDSYLTEDVIDFLVNGVPPPKNILRNPAGPRPVFEPNRRPTSR